MAKKVERVVTAIYLVSQFMSDKESLKFSLRAKADDLLANINAVANAAASNIESEENIFVFYKNALKDLRDLTSFFRVTKDANLISKMNVEIVIDALTALEDILIKKQFSFAKENLKIQDEEKLSEDLPPAPSQGSGENANTVLNTDESDKLNTVIKMQNAKTISVDKNHSQSDNQFKSVFRQKEDEEKLKENTIRQNISIRQNEILPKAPSKGRRVNASLVNKSALIQERKENRRDQILNIFVSGKEYSIKDIAKKIPGCSEKTVSRELDNLIAENLVRREGERRWARYLLA